MSASVERPLRSQRGQVGLRLGLAPRALRFITSLILARVIIMEFGTGTWGVLP